MATEAEPYTAIPGFFEKSPGQLSARGGPMEYSPMVTAMARGALNLFFSDIIIEDADIERYILANPAVVVPTHRSKFDMSLMSYLGKICGEGQPYFLSKRENMEKPLKAKFFGKMRTFPIDRDMPGQNWSTIFAKWSKFALCDGAEFEGTEGFENLVDKPRKLVIFGEGTRKTGSVVETMFAGPLVAAKRNKALILPVGIAGTDQLGFRDFRSIAVVTVGEAYEVTDMRDTATLVERVQEQFDRANAILLERAE